MEVNIQIYKNNHKNYYYNYFKKAGTNYNTVANLYLQNLYYSNNKTGETLKLHYSNEKNYKDKYYNFIIKNIYNIDNIKNKKNYVALFFTFTLNPDYHPVKNNKVNKNFNADTLKVGYRALYKSYRKLLKNFKRRYKNGSKNIILHFGAYEPHKTFVPHLHFVLIVKKDIKNKIINYVNKYIKNKNGMGKELDIQEIENLKKSVGYISKYIKKTFAGGKKGINADVLKGWQKELGIKNIIFTNNTKIPKFVYKTLFIQLQKDIKKYIKKNKKNFNTLKFLENITSYNIKYIDNDKNIYKEKNYKSRKNRYSADVVVQKTTTFKLKSEFETEKIIMNKVVKNIKKIEIKNKKIYIFELLKDIDFIQKVGWQSVEKTDLNYLFYILKIHYSNLLNNLYIVKRLKNKKMKRNYIKLLKIFKNMKNNILNENDINVENVKELIYSFNEYIENIDNNAGFLEEVNSYKVVEYVLTDNKANTVIYNKKDWELVEIL